MRAVDIFVIADTVQYSRQSRQNRARLRTPNGAQWISIPLVGGQSGLDIRSIRVAESANRWQTKHRRALKFNYGSAPYYDHYAPLVLPILESRATDLVAYTVPSVRTIVRLLKLETPVILASDLHKQPATLAGILDELDGELVSLPDSGASDSRHGVARWLLRFHATPYRQNFDGFVEGLSMLDALMNVGPDAGLLACGDVDLFPSGRLP